MPSREREKLVPGACRAHPWLFYAGRAEPALPQKC